MFDTKIYSTGFLVYRGPIMLKTDALRAWKTHCNLFCWSQTRRTWDLRRKQVAVSGPHLVFLFTIMYDIAWALNVSGDVLSFSGLRTMMRNFY